MNTKTFTRAFLFLGLFFVCSAFLQCATNKPPTPNPPPPAAVDAGTSDGGVSCDAVCAHVALLDCPNADACLGVCSSVSNQGFRVCVVGAGSCAEVTDCNRPPE